MHVAPADQADLPCHRLVAALSPDEDRALPLRMVSLLHRRGVTLVELRLEATAGTTSEPATPDRFTAVFRSTAQHADVVAAGFGHLVGVVDVDLRAAQPARPPSMENVAEVTIAESSEAR